MLGRRRSVLPLVGLLTLVGLGAGSSDSRLAEAVKNRDQTAVKALLKQRVDVNAPLADGTTALHWAAYWNNVETAALLIQGGADVNAVNRYGATPLWTASGVGNARMVQALLKAGANPSAPAIGGESPLLPAARAGSVEAVRALLAQGADVNAREAWRGQTALMLAVGGHETYPEVAQLLIQAGADVNIRSERGFTALLFAVRQGDLQSTRILVEAGADVNAKGPGGGNALLTAIGNSHYNIATFLLDNGADANAGLGGFSPLHVVVRRRGGEGSRGRRESSGTISLMKALMAHDANLNARTPKPQKPRDAQPSPRPEIDAVELGGVTPFWLAAKNVDVEAMRLLAAKGANPGIRSLQGTTPLMVAAGLGYGQRRSDSDAEVQEAIKLLMELGNDINAVNDHGQTAVHGAVYAASPATIQFLVDNGAYVDRKDAIGRTPLLVANDNRSDKYQSNQNLEPTRVESTWALLRQLSGEADLK